MGLSSRIARRVRVPVTAAAAAVATVGLVGLGGALATPPQGNVSRTELAKGRTTGPVSIQTSTPSDFHIHQVMVEPGASSGWHHHPGPEYTIIKSGTGTLYRGSCDPVTVAGGQVMFIPGGMNHNLRNDGTEPMEIYVTYTVPADAGVRVDEPAPEGCSVQ